MNQINHQSKMRYFILTFLITVVISDYCAGQVQNFAFRYQGVAYDGNSPIATAFIAVELNVLEGSPFGPKVYTETRQDVPVTNGLFNVTIGSEGTLFMQGKLNELNWGVEPYFLETKISISNDPLFTTTIGVTEILGTPWLNPVHQLILSSKSDLAPEYGELFFRGGAGSAANYYGIYHVDGPDNPSIRRNFWFQGAGSRNLDVSVDGQLAIGALKDGVNFTHTLEVTGSACKSMGGSSWSVCSDPRIKNAIKPLELGLSTLKKINPIWFEYNEKIAPELGTGIRLGLNAQEIADIPELGPLMIETHDKYGIPDLKMITASDALMYLNVNAIKEQQEMIEKQNELIAIQQVEIDNQKIQLRNLIQRMEAIENGSSTTSAELIKK